MSQSQLSLVIRPQTQPHLGRVTGHANLPATQVYFVHRDLLCWDLEDMAFISLNKVKEEEKSVISKEARNELKEWLKGKPKNLNNSVWYDLV